MQGDEAKNLGVPTGTATKDSPLSAAPTFTQGRWYWRLDLNSRQVTLQSEGNMRQIVMDFARWGNGASPRFGKDGLMERADTFASTIEGREHHAAWFQDIDHPDARLIAAAPALYSALERTLTHLRACMANRPHACADEAVAEAESALAAVNHPTRESASGTTVQGLSGEALKALAALHIQTVMLISGRQQGPIPVVVLAQIAINTFGRSVVLFNVPSAAFSFTLTGGRCIRMALAMRTRSTLQPNI